MNVESICSDSVLKLYVDNPLQVEFSERRYDISVLSTERPVPLTEVLDEISPLLFAGLINIDYVSENRIDFERLLRD